jgi:hypothetical protein
MPLAARPALGLGSGAALPGARSPGFRENGLMATDDRGIQDIVAGRLRVMIGT